MMSASVTHATKPKRPVSMKKAAAAVMRKNIMTMITSLSQEVTAADSAAALISTASKGVSGTKKPARHHA